MSILENVEEYVKSTNNILQELSTLEGESFATKTEYIVRLREVTRPLIESGYYPGVKLVDMASFIQNDLLVKHKISYNNSGDYYALFKDEEKHTEYNSSRTRDKISSPLPIEKQTGDETIDKLKQAARSGESIPLDYQYQKYLEKIIDVSSETIKQSESLIRKLGSSFYFINKFDNEFPDKKELQTELRSTRGKKQKELSELYTHYLLCEDVIKDIESGIGSTQNKIDELNETLATQKFISKQIDERSKITFLEKWNTIIAEIEIGISAIAKKLGVNKKHCTNNIRPTNNPVTNARNKHHDYISWFTHISVVTPEGKRLIFNAKNYFDSQIERAKLQVPFEDLILKNCEIK